MIYLFIFYTIPIHLIQALTSATSGPDTPHSTILLIQQFKFNNFFFICKLGDK